MSEGINVKRLPGCHRIRLRIFPQWAEIGFLEFLAKRDELERSGTFLWGHRASLMYGIVAIMIATFVETSQLATTVAIVATLALVAYVALTIVIYMVHGYGGDTGNPSRELSAAIRRWTVKIDDVAIHGGTTSIPGGKDALATASKLAIAINERTTRVGDRQAATDGELKAFPGAPNVIPGKVQFSLDIRDLDADKIQHVYEVVQQQAKADGGDTGVEITFDTSNVDFHAAPTHVTLRSPIEPSARDRGFTYPYMPSGNR